MHNRVNRECKQGRETGIRKRKLLGEKKKKGENLQQRAKRGEGLI